MVSQTANPGMVILDPTSPPLAVDARLVARPSDLNGKVLGLLNNSKLNAANLPDEVGELLSERYQFAKVIKGSKPNASTPCPEAIVKEFAASCCWSSPTGIEGPAHRAVCTTVSPSRNWESQLRFCAPIPLSPPPGRCRASWGSPIFTSPSFPTLWEA